MFVVLGVLELALVVGRADLKLIELLASASFHVGIKGMYHHHLTCDPLTLTRDCLCGQGFGDIPWSLVGSPLGDTPWSLVGSPLVNTTEENGYLLHRIHQLPVVHQGLLAEDELFKT